MEDVQVAPWILVIPVKRTAIAKSRLAAAYPQHRPELARAFAADTTTAALASPLVRAVLVVTDDPQVAADVTAAGARVVPDLPASPTHPSLGGLNEALTHGAAIAAAEFFGAGVAALSADLPALRPDELTAALAACVADRSFVIDQPGTGTTMLAAAPGVALDPRFGVGSALAHQASGAVPLALPIPSVRRDVDTAADLADAIQLGVGPHTADVLSIVLGAATGSEGLAC
ncbi:2-phospho-L-lactate guanylyltransferase [Kribbella sp. NPDC051770]|uniref:2-phospho-L-lactate guanylyltransferase n=1 Tax=Kribbella sp. NPDC051770 TaxID=3155413 RepID=UPI003443EAA5